MFRISQPHIFLFLASMQLLIFSSNFVYTFIFGERKRFIFCINTQLYTDNDLVGQYVESITKDNGERLNTLCEQNNLKILNGFFQHRWIHKYTWTQETKNLKMVIDYLIIRQYDDMILYNLIFSTYCEYIYSLYNLLLPSQRRRLVTYTAVPP